MNKHFHLPSTDTAKGKSITVLCMAIIIISLYVMSYLLFLRTVDVDVTKDASIVYRGETGSASVKVRNVTKNYNQRIQEFMDSIYYEVVPQTAIANDDTLTIKAHYDKELARRYNIKPINVTRKVKVQDLPIRFEDVTKIPDKYYNTMKEQGKVYLKNNIDSILLEDFTTFSLESQPELEDYTLVYRTFLDALNIDGKDKVIDIYAIRAKGDVKTSNEKETTEEQVETIFYMITYNEVNTSLKILDENVYGEKIITANTHDLKTEEGYESYMNNKYGSSYNLRFLELNK